jgi:hypothetical protein
VPTEPIEPTEPVDQEIPKKKQRLGYSRQGKEKEPVLEELISILKNAGIR